jgi:SAM-dependent methyltransferase
MRTWVKIVAKLVESIAPNAVYVKFKGHCPCCDRSTHFFSRNLWFRDELKCLSCGSIPRERALMLALNKHYPQWRDLKIHESSPVDRGASHKISREAPDYVGSQFYPDQENIPMIDGFHNINLEAQAFPDQSFDLVITQDVLEHLPNPENAFREIHRTLKTGGAHIFSVPLVNRHAPSEVWARISDHGEVEFLHEPEYHGNPVNPKGSPVMMHWGFDLMDKIKDVTQMSIEVEDHYDLKHGVAGEYNEIVIAKKQTFF